MSRLILAALLALSTLLTATPAVAQTSTRDEIRLIEQEYARQHDGRMIPDTQLEYYLDRADSGWTMNQISQDMANSRRQYANSQWRPQSGWTPREVVCTSDGNKYRECAAPFRGRAMVTQQISRSSCVEGQSWGQKSGVIWVNRGCRARFGMVPGSNGGNSANNRMIVCQSDRNRYRECKTGTNRPVVLVNRLNNSATCTEGRSWGQRNGMVWVNHGCRAQFTAANRQNGGGNWSGSNGGNYNNGNNYEVTCSSSSNDLTRCNWDSRYGQPRMVQQLSQSACAQGRSWDYDDRGLWVDNGCRARFANH